MPETRNRLLVCLIMLAAAFAAGARADDAADKEIAVRAAFLFRLAFFINWPPGTFESADSPLKICLRERPPAPLAQVLREQTATRTVQERAVQIVALGPDAPAAGCHLLYVELGSDAAPPPDYALVVVDSLDRLDHDGALALVRESTADGARLVFYADRARLDAAPFTVSAQLLRLVRFHGGAG